MSDKDDKLPAPADDASGDQAMDTAARDAFLDGVRGHIDHIDEQILNLLNRRAGLSLEVGRLKQDSDEVVFKPFREREVLERLAGLSAGPLPDEHLRAIYREIMSSSRRLQRRQKVAFLGPEGTFSHLAALAFLGQSASFEARPALADVFEAVTSREVELGVVPLENSLEGSVGQTLDLFLRHKAFIQAELFFKISHCLLSRETELSNVTAIYSHPQPLAQCAGWLRAHCPDIPVAPAPSTAQAARLAAETPGAAAIGHVKLAERFGLNVLARRIEDLPDNWTRFFVIGPKDTRSGHRDKTSILFTLPDKAGALSGVLSHLAREGINLTKLESRPLRGEKWKYVFFADLECDLTLDEYQSVLASLASATMTFRILGGYPAGPYLDASDSGVVEVDER